MHTVTGSENSPAVASRTGLGASLAITSEKGTALSSLNAQSSDSVAWRRRQKWYLWRLRERLKAMRCSQVRSEESPRKRARAAVGADEGVLGDLLRVGVVAQVAERNREHPSAVARQDLDKRVLVSGIESAHQPGVMRCLLA